MSSEYEMRKEIILWQIVNGTYGRGIICVWDDKRIYKNPTPENLKPFDDGFKQATSLLRGYFHIDDGGKYKEPSCLDEYNMAIMADGTIKVTPKWNRSSSERLFALGLLSNHYTICADYYGIWR